MRDGGGGLLHHHIITSHCCLTWADVTWNAPVTSTAWPESRACFIGTTVRPCFLPFIVLSCQSVVKTHRRILDPDSVLWFSSGGLTNLSSKLMVKALLSGAELGSDSIPFRREGMPVEGGAWRRLECLESVCPFSTWSSLKHTGSPLRCTGLSSCGTSHVWS